jgi:hypothetical protein
MGGRVIAVHRLVVSLHTLISIFKIFLLLDAFYSTTIAPPCKLAAPEKFMDISRKMHVGFRHKNKAVGELPHDSTQFDPYLWGLYADFSLKTAQNH